MKSNKYWYILLVFFVLGFPSCSKSVIPAGLKGKSKESYDAAAFNYVYVEALKQKLMGNGGDALKYLEQCIKINPSSDAAYYQMAQIVTANGDLKNGKHYLNEALSIDNENIWYLKMLAEGKYDEAMSKILSLLKEYPDEILYNGLLAEIYRGKGENQKAHDVYNKLLE